MEIKRGSMMITKLIMNRLMEMVTEPLLYRSNMDLRLSLLFWLDCSLKLGSWYLGRLGGSREACLVIFD
jgi:hypothetical protein